MMTVISNQREVPKMDISKVGAPHKPNFSANPGVSMPVVLSRGESGAIFKKVGPDIHVLTVVEVPSKFL